MLKGSSIRVVGEAATLNGAVESVRAHRADVLLVDLQILVGDSTTFLAGIEAARPMAKVVVVASLERAADLPHAIGGRCSGFLTKHVTPQGLVKAVRAVVNGESVVEPGLLNELLGELAKRPTRIAVEPTDMLSVTERDVLRLIAEGKTNRHIAQELGYSLGTVKNYVQKIMAKLGVTDRVQAAVKAARVGLHTE